MHKVLLIDDDEKLAKLLSEYFHKFDIELSSATLPSKGIELFKETTPDLMILDVMLPEMDGFELCKMIRAESNVPIIMLTARGDISDRVVGLGIGADDYLPKPFEPKELVARITSILDRISSDDEKREKNILNLGDLSINKDSYEVFVAGNKIDLTTKEYALLLLFTNHINRIFSRDDIMNELSGIDSELFSRSVDILVSRLRSKLKPLSNIETVWGAGYKFVINR